MALPKVPAADSRKFVTGYDPELSAASLPDTGHQAGRNAYNLTLSDPDTGVGNPLAFPDPRPSPAVVAREAKAAAELESQRLAHQRREAERAEKERLAAEKKSEAEARRLAKAAEQEAKALQKEARIQAKSQSNNQSKNQSQAKSKSQSKEQEAKMKDANSISKFGHSTPPDPSAPHPSANATGYEGSYTQEAAYEVANAIKNGKLPVDDAQYLLKLLQRHYGEPDKPVKQQTPYGVGFDLMSEIEEQLEIVRAMKNQVFTFSGSVKPGVEFKDAKAVMDSNHKMIGTLMTHMKELVNMRALQEIEEATHKAIETLPAQFADMFYQELAKRLKGRGK